MGAIEKGRGRFVWFDLFTTDQAAARAFYNKVVGWGDQLFGEDYHMFVAAEGQTIGGSGDLPADAKAMGMPPYWLGYIGTPDVDATAKQAEKLGGKILLPGTDIPTVGRFAIIQDPQGAVFAAFTSFEEAPGHEGAAKLGEIGWHELSTSDPAGALAFYSALFGWTKGDAMDMGPELGTYQMFKRPGAQNHTGGIQKKADAVPFSNWLYYFAVTDTNKALETAKANGGSVIYGPVEVAGGALVAAATDPQGAAFALMQFAP